MPRLAARSLALLALVVAVLLAGRGSAHASTADNGTTNITVSGPVAAGIGQTVTYTAVVRADTAGAFLQGLATELTVSIPAGATAITITDSDTGQVCAPQVFVASPVAYTSCQGYFIPDGGSVTLTITLTLGPTAAPLFSVSATVGWAGVFVTASQLTAVSVASVAQTGNFPATTFSAPPFSGANFDPRCTYGCGPNGLP